jgi:hypothetical protein
MKRRFLCLLIPSFFLFIVLIPKAFCQGQGNSPVNITQIPEAIGQALGIPEPNTAVIGGLIISLVIIMAIVLPSLLLGNKAVTLVFLFIALSLVTGLGWLSSWVLLMIVLLIAGTMSRQIMKWFR